jgi:uncharacterized protein (TIGR03435 family)
MPSDYGLVTPNGDRLTDDSDDWRHGSELMNRFICFVLSGFAGVALAQTSSAARFEVASVKRSPPILDRRLDPFLGVAQPGLWRVRDQPMLPVLRNIYPGHQFPGEVVGAPDWVSSDYYDIEAKMNPASTADDARQMARALLAERFKLVVHQEQREVAAFVLTQKRDGKLGPGLKPPAVDCAAFRNGGPRPVDPRPKNADRLPCAVTALPAFDSTLVIPGVDTRITAGDVPIARILTLLGNQLKRPVVDGTNLTQRFDIELQFSAGPVRPDVENGPPIRAAIGEQLGLQVEEGKAMVDVLVIDHIERPTEN